MRRIKSLLIALAILAGSVALAVFLVSLAPEPERIEPPSQLPFVTTATVAAGQGPIPVFGAGTVRPSAQVDIAPQVSGRVVWVDPAFQSGGRFEAGQVLFRIDEANYVYRLREAEATLADRRVAYLEAREEAAIARAEFERFASRNPDSAEPVETSPLASREPQLAAAQAALDRDEARVAEANRAVARTRVTAPFNGYVRDESVDVGQFVATGQSVARLFSADAVEVVAPLSDANAALIPGLWNQSAGVDGQRIAARAVAEYGDTRYAWEGYVDRAEASLDEQTRTIDVIVRVPDPFTAGVPVGVATALDGAPPLLVGKFVDVEIEGLAPLSYFRVQRAALRPGNEVWAVDDNGAVTIVPVRTLQRGDDEVYVTGSLEDGQAVITGGIQFATDGMRVRTGAAPGP
ncbi:MAG: efflux RND transporter periplasmic adaptor subunit [Gammaproteobacteria bacterium]|nr:efflux RND transporter periplasmic adaptor subunit [Rhodospirillaceae bacterium]MDE0064143.1 efflux RND transporter periplasmic adaptor subunit [Gammaproteobacteria bacterium]MDE0359561.1 efflux RND transporter periplasmic adaptor subunit [Rhodospirillaceae bacterium]